MVEACYPDRRDDTIIFSVGDLEIYLSGEAFCISRYRRSFFIFKSKCYRKDCFICALCDINRIDPSTVASLDEPQVMFVKYIVMRLMREKEAGSKKLAKFADVIDRIVEACRHIYALWMLMRR